MEMQVRQADIMSQDLFALWIRFLDVSPKTVETYKKAVKQFYIYLDGRPAPERSDVIAYRDHLLNTRKPATVQLYMTAIKMFFRWTAQQGLYPNIADHVKGAKIDREHKKDYLNSAQAGNLLHEIDRSSVIGKRDYALLALMLTTGIRTIEAARANVEDIRTIGGEPVLYVQGKGHQERSAYVKLAAPVEAAIRDYLRSRTAASSLFTSESRNSSGQRMTTRSISRIVKTYLRGAGMDSDRLTAHSLRHTAATLNLLSGGSIEETQQLLRHKDVNTTYIYAHALERAKNQSENRIADAIFS